MKSKQYLIIFLFTCIQISVFGQINLKISRPKEDILLKELTQHNANVLDYEFIFSKQEIIFQKVHFSTLYKPQNPIKPQKQYQSNSYQRK